jgi:hypothetical protein
MLDVTGSFFPVSVKGFDACVTWPAAARAATVRTRANVSFFISVVTFRVEFRRIAIQRFRAREYQRDCQPHVPSFLRIGRVNNWLAWVIASVRTGV